jgi:hypothetical protein
VDLLVRVLIAGAAFAVTGALVARWPGLLLARRPWPLAVLCVAAAGGAAAAAGNPTALPAVDVVLRMALAMAVTAACARARRQVWLIASTATVVAGTGAPFDWLAFVATGATLAMLALDRRSWIVGGLIGGCLVQVLLRLEVGPTTGTSATVAAAIAGLVILSGLRRARPVTRRRSWIAAGVLAGAAVVFTAAAGLAAANATGDVREGIDAGKDGLNVARQGDAPKAVERFGRSADAFGRARADLGRWWARPALAVPLVGQQVRAVRALSQAGEELAGSASTAASELDLKGLRVQQGTIDLATVGRAAGSLAAARRSLDRAAADVDSVRSPWLLSPLADAIGDLDTPMAEARRDVGTAAEVLELAAPMLGRDGPRRWFLAVVTPAENRGSGGLIGNTAEITATAGKLALVDVQRVARLNEAVDDTAAGRVLPPVYAEAYQGWKVPAKLQNVTVAADFPTAAEALEAVIPLAGRSEVDGTISIDPLAVAALLDVVGPVSVPSWPVPISAGNAASVLLHEQYVALEEDARENFLSEVIHAVWDRTTTGSLSPKPLTQALANAVRGRHIQLHSRRAEEQAAVARLGAAGAVPRSGADHLGLVTDNASQSKADWFLRRAVDYHLRYDPGSRLADATVKVTLTNDAPPSGLPPYVLGGDVVPPGHNRQIVQVYSPLDLEAATVDGHPPPPAALRSLGRAGNWAHELDVDVPPRSSITIELRLAGRLGGPPGRWSLDVDRQSAVRPDAVTVTFDVPDGWRIAATGGGLTGRGRTANASLELDRHVQLWAEMTRKKV